MLFLSKNGITRDLGCCRDDCGRFYDGVAVDVAKIAHEGVMSDYGTAGDKRGGRHGRVGLHHGEGFHATAHLELSQGAHISRRVHENRRSDTVVTQFFDEIATNFGVSDGYETVMVAGGEFFDVSGRADDGDSFRTA